MTETVKVKNASYAKYEEVLLRRDNLKKEAEQYHISYIREFGYLIEESFRLKVECIRKKKEIAFCQRLANMGKPINRNDLTAFIEKEMQQYYDELQSVINDVKTAKNSAHVSPMSQADPSGPAPGIRHGRYHHGLLEQDNHRISV